MFSFYSLNANRQTKRVITFALLPIHHFISKNPSTVHPAKFKIVQIVNFSPMEVEKPDALTPESLEKQWEGSVWYEDNVTPKPQNTESLM